MTQGDGNGWVGCDQDHRHWGRHGAAGLLIWAPDGSGRPLVLLIRRAGWSHHGGTWGPPGGARDSHESPAEAAMREAAEHPQLVARGSIVAVGGIDQPAPAPRLSRTPGAVRRPPVPPATDTVEALQAWGIDDARVRGWLDAGAVFGPDAPT